MNNQTLKQNVEANHGKKYAISRMIYEHDIKIDRQPLLAVKEANYSSDLIEYVLVDLGVKYIKIIIEPESDWIVIPEKQKYGSDVKTIIVIEQFNEESVY